MTPRRVASLTIHSISKLRLPADCICRHLKPWFLLPFWQSLFG